MHSAPVTCLMTWPPPAMMARNPGGGFDGKGNALPAEMLPAQITFNDVQFQSRSSEDRRAQRGRGEGTDD